MAKKDEKGLILSDGELKPVKKNQKFQQWWYGLTEPLILKYANYMLADEKRSKKYAEMKKPKSLPSGIIISTEAACRFVDFIYSHNTANNSARMAVTECVCQTALNMPREPRVKDMALLYTSDMYTKMKHNGVGQEYKLIETAEEAKEMLRYFDKCGLMHNVLYCHSSGKWTFVMCNCDDKVCIPFRSYMAGRTEEMAAGPETIVFDGNKCLGKEKCGKCLERCILKATYLTADGKISVDNKKCLGCGLCVSTCEGGARHLVPRGDYQHEDVLTTKILLGEKTDGIK